MPLNSHAVGYQTKPHLFEVTARRTIAYAAGLGDINACYFDDAQPAGVIAHPAFCVAVEWPVAIDVRQSSPLGGTPDETLRAVHASQDSTFHRPIRPGDRLRTVATLMQLRAIRPGAFLLTKFETVDNRTGEPVVTSFSGTIYRGVSMTGEDTQLDDVTVYPAIPQPSGAWQSVAIPVARQAPHIYTECADIWNPIHTERQVALKAGLPDIIFHGTATWALALSTLVNQCADGDPVRVHRFAGRFAAMVIPGTTIHLQYGARQAADNTVPFAVCNEEGAPAISHGLAIIG